MIIYVAHLYECDEQHSALFTASFDQDGLLSEISKDLPGHLYTQLLRHSSLPHIYLALEFWVSESHYLRARRSVPFAAWQEWLKAMTVAQMHFDIFRSRSQDGDEGAESRLTLEASRVDSGTIR